MEVNHSKIKETNRKKIISLLLVKNEITKLDISRELNISITTVSTNINELKELGIVEDVRSMESTGGRKAMSIRLVEDCRYSIGVALTPNHVKISLVNIKKEQIEYMKIRHNKDTIENIVEVIKNAISNIITKYSVSNDKLLGICFSIPGLVDMERGIIKNCYFLGLTNYDLRESFEYLGSPIYVNNEANLSSFYEFINKTTNFENLLYISITDGLGLGIIISKEIYKGNNDAAGELGHIKIQLDGRPCNCGGFGCLEAYTSKNILSKDYNDLSENKIDNVDDFIEKYFEGDSIAIVVLDKYLTYLAVGISNLIMILDPSSIIIGGDINKLLNENILKLTEMIHKQNSFKNERDYEVKVADFKESYLLGAALLPIEEFLTIK